MTTNNYGNTSVESIRIFLNLWPSISSELNSFWNDISEDEHLLFNDKTEPIVWCHFYELPFGQHPNHVNLNLLNNPDLDVILEKQHSSADPIGSLPDTLLQARILHDESIIPTREQALDLMPSISYHLGYGFSCYFSLKSIIHYGCFINELITRVRLGDDVALFNAVRVDPTVIGCRSVIARISKARVLQDDSFLKKLRSAINGKPKSRDQKNYQKMRLVLQVLVDANAPRLNDDQLHHLFVESLGLYHWDAKEGGNAKALRKFADTYIKKHSTT